MLKKISLFITFICAISINSRILAVSEFCDITSDMNVLAVFKLGGVLLNIVKIVVPLMLIILGMIDLSKAVISDKQDEIKNNAIIFAKRGIAAILVFFVPTIVLQLFGMVENWTKIEGDFKPCINCLLDTHTCENVTLIKGFKG